MTNKPPTTEDFQRRLQEIIEDAQKKHQESVIVRSRDLHDQVGGYPNGSNHRMPECCNAMRKAMRDQFLDSSLKPDPSRHKDGANLRIRYDLRDRK